MVEMIPLHGEKATGIFTAAPTFSRPARRRAAGTFCIEPANPFAFNEILRLTPGTFFALVTLLEIMARPYPALAVLAGCILCGFEISAAPLTWFPGPAMDYPGSDAATVVLPGPGNVVIAGTTAYPEGLIATNIYWTPLGQPFYSVNIAPGAVASGGSIIVYGGNDGVSSVSTVINYSSSDGPSTLASMSVPRSCLGYAPDRNGNAYAIGGLDDAGQPLASAERYNPDADTWSAIAVPPGSPIQFSCGL